MKLPLHWPKLFWGGQIERQCWELDYVQSQAVHQQFVGSKNLLIC